MNFETIEKFEAGISLRGFEVKSLKDHQGSISESYVSIKDCKDYLMDAHIPAYQPKNTTEGFDPYQMRKLLLSKKQLVELADKVKKSNLTIMPISLYNKGRKLKLQIAIARGKKKQDKRETLKKRTTEREVRREHKFR